MRQRENVVSEHPRDDDELQSFLEGDSVLSRRYRDASDEQPPAKVDAAILAASQWAVGAEPGQGDQRSRAARPGGAAHGGSRWWDRLFLRWSVPLATAAVVVIAATLTLMIERDPELERIEREYRPAASDAPDQRSDNIAERMMAEQGGVADADEMVASPSPKVSVPETVKPEQAKTEQVQPERAKPAPERLAFRPVEQDAAVIAKDTTARTDAARKEAAKSEAAVSAAGRPAMPAQQVLSELEDDVVQLTMPPAAVSARPTEEKSMPANIAVPAERRRDADALRAEDTSVAGMASEQTTASVTAETQAFSAAQPMAQANGPAQGGVASSQTVTGAQEGATAPPGTGSARTQAPASSDTRATARDPERWIADIEEQLALGNRELARAAVRNFRERYPEYKLPDALEQLLPANESGTGAPDPGDQ